jgi:hypothetical protein
MWQTLIKILESVVPDLIKKYATQIIMSAAGFTSASWAWIINFSLNRLWKKEIDPALKKGAAQLDETKKENDNLKKYKDAVKSGDLNEIAKTGSDFLNG